MGSYIETNDTLQITREQEFPKELNYEKHKVVPYTPEEMQHAHNIIDRNEETRYIE